MVGNFIKKGLSAGDLRFCLFVFIIVSTAVAIVHRAGLPYGSVIIPALWGFGSFLALRRGEGDLIIFGLTTPLLGQNLKYFLLSSLVVFPLYTIGFHLHGCWGFYQPAGTVLDGLSAPRWLLYNFLAVALFEEMFFRGYVQGQFEKYVKSSFMRAGTLILIPVLMSSLLFALAHAAIYLDPSRFAVFFPGLLFAWLRAKTGSLLAPVLSHGTANLVHTLLNGSVT